MVVVNGANYTGDLSAKNGSTIQVQTGGTLAPSTANNFAGTLVNNGTVNLNNISLSNGAAITNSGTFTWLGNWNQNNAITVSNTSCGTMTFSTGTNVNSSAVILNSGILNFAGDLNTSSGTTINNRGVVTVTGNFTSSGLFYNQYKAIFKGSSNNINSGDSIVNLAYMTFAGSVTSSTGIRNEGLFTTGGSYTISSNKFVVNNSNSQLRAKGSLSNNAQITGNGSLHVAGSIVNNSSVSGKNASQKLQVNKNISGTTSNLTVNTSLAAADTSTYIASMANPDICSVLPLQISAVQAVYKYNQVQLYWNAYAQSNARSFTIEYSRDGQTFATAGEVAAAGTNNQTTSYQYTHYTSETGNLFYRIRETAVDGTIYYSSVVLVKTGNATNVITQVFPNPFADNLQISLQLQNAVMIRVTLYDAEGRMVKTLMQQGLTGRNTIVAGNLSSLLPGVYVACIRAGDHTIFHKLTK